MLFSLLQDLEVDEKTRFSDLMNSLFAEKLPALMRIIFAGQPVEGIDWEQDPYAMVDEVIEDFFVLNPRLIGRLKSLLGNLSSLTTNRTN